MCKRACKSAPNNRINNGLAKAAPLRYAPSASRLCAALCVMSKFRISKTVEEYESKLREFEKGLRQFSETKLSLAEYASVIFASTTKGAIEVMEDNSGVWVEYWKSDEEEVDHEASFNSYNEALESIKYWLCDT